MLGAFAAFALCAMLLIIFVFREKPPTPPPQDPATENEEEIEPVGICEGMKILCSKSPDYILTLLTGSILLGTLAYGYTALIGQFMLPFGIDDVEFVSWAGVTYNFGGILGNLLASLVACKLPNKLEAVFLTVALTSTLTYIYFFVATMGASRVNIIISCLLVGIANLPVFTVSYELAVQQTMSLGIGEALSCGLINSFGNVIGWASVIGMTPLLDQVTEKNSIISQAILIVLLGVSVICTIALVIRKQSKDKSSGDGVELEPVTSAINRQ